MLDLGDLLYYLFNEYYVAFSSLQLRVQPYSLTLLTATFYFLFLVLVSRQGVPETAEEVSMAQPAVERRRAYRRKRIGQRHPGERGSMVDGWPCRPMVDC